MQDGSFTVVPDFQVVTLLRTHEIHHSRECFCVLTGGLEVLKNYLNM